MNTAFPLIAQLYYTDYNSYAGAPADMSGLPWGWILIGLSMLASVVVSSVMKSRMQSYSELPIPLSGRDIAERMLQENGIYDVRVLSTPGRLTDHYNPADKTINLSEMVYDSRTVSAAAVAAHECGHAVQHAQAYHWLSLRSALVPVVNVSSHLAQIVLVFGILLLLAGSSPTVAWIGLGLFAMTTLFAFVTLPVEFDASRRALAWIQRTGLSATVDYAKARNALFWAAMTYVVGALSSLAMLLYYAMRIMAATRRN